MNKFKIIKMHCEDLARCEKVGDTITCTVCNIRLFKPYSNWPAYTLYVDAVSAGVSFQSLQHGDYIYCFCCLRELELFKLNPLAYE